MPSANDPEFPPVVLTFAASDPSGGAGLQADILTLASMGCHPLSVVTAITVQDTLGVEGIQALDAEWVADQARCLLEDMPVDAFKIGVLGSVEIIAAIAEIVSDYPDVPLVLDPVLASGRGDAFATDEMTDAMRELLLPHTTIVTPNSMEARRLADVDDDDDASLALCAERLIAMGAEYVLITGTHEATPDVVNTLYGKSGVVRSDTWARLPGSYHGSGCTLASAIAAMLANGLDLPEAVREAQDYTWQTLKKAYRPGMGQFLPDRLFWAREDARDARGGRRRAARLRCPAVATDDRLPAAPGARATAPRALRGDAGPRGHRRPRRARRSRARRRRQRDPVPQQGGGRRRNGARRPRRSPASHALRGGLYIVNDDAALAAAVGADGVHVGEDDGGIAAARELLGPDRIIGVSCYDDLERARSGGRRRCRLRRVRELLPVERQAGRAARADVALLERAASLGVPVVAIGGITAENAGVLQRAGADAVAVISAVFDAPDVEAAARAIASPWRQPSPAVRRA